MYLDSASGMRLRELQVAFGATRHAVRLSMLDSLRTALTQSNYAC